ncbi:hypothetical protein K504DRAFT_535280 [Pleomassaria siparia CBS 279.74]|uniref:Uncharacterized protein n=1 Tax=Pleomassaria siparia CBS 279.74 TaxID=1314801 RepID=A0A6G1K543_9PLEO|nr:hypothetical protein K504DRAFT_535280 [Pleomassaria siparia CBS 279.74]
MSPVVVSLKFRATTRRKSIEVDYMKLKGLCRHPDFLVKNSSYDFSLPSAFIRYLDIFVNWIDNGVYKPRDNWSQGTLPSLYCWLLGERLMCESFQDAAMMNMYFHYYEALDPNTPHLMKSGTLITGYALRVALKHSTERDSLFRQFLYDMAMVRRPEAEWVAQAIDHPGWANEKKRHMGIVAPIEAYLNSNHMTQGKRYPIRLALPVSSENPM